MEADVFQGSDRQWRLKGQEPALLHRHQQSCSRHQQPAADTAPGSNSAAPNLHTSTSADTGTSADTFSNTDTRPH
jgi:hypothetical protein